MLPFPMEKNQFIESIYSHQAIDKSLNTWIIEF